MSSKHRPKQTKSTSIVGGKLREDSTDLLQVSHVASERDREYSVLP